MDRTSIANLALLHLGDRFIDDIDDADDSDANTLKKFYEHARDTVYEAHDWKWAKRALQLQLIATPPTVRYDYAYALPSHFRRLTNISQYDTMDPQLDEFDIVDRTLTTNAGFAFLEFVASDWSEAVWPAYFSDCVGMKLAEMCCMRITHNTGQKRELASEFQKSTLPYARSIDSQSQPARKRFIRSDWTRLRFGRRSSENLRKS
jgi:hypothetical protein